MASRPGRAKVPRRFRRIACFAVGSIALGAASSSLLAQQRAAGAPAAARAVDTAAAASGMSFRDVSQEAGLTTVPHTSTERRYIVETMGGGGVALLDCDNDGRLDIAVVNDTTIERYLGGGDPMITLYRQDGAADKVHFTDATEAAGL